MKKTLTNWLSEMKPLPLKDKSNKTLTIHTGLVDNLNKGKIEYNFTKLSL